MRFLLEIVMLIKISWIVNLDPSYIVKQRNKSTSLPLGVAITTLLAGAATLPFYPIVGTYLVTGSAIFAVAAIVRFLWASYMRNQIKERKERQLLQSEKKCSKELNQLTTIELRIRELIFQESVKEFEIKKLLAGANSLYHIVQNDHPLLGKASFDRINNYVSDKGLLQGILKSSSVEKIRQHSELSLIHI